MRWTVAGTMPAHPKHRPHLGWRARHAQRRLDALVRRYRPGIRQRRPWPLKVLRAGIGTLLALLVAVPSAAGTGLFVYLFGPLPAAPVEMPALEPTVGSTVVYADGSVLGRFEPRQDRQLLAPAEIPEVAVTALLAAEDRRFYENSGIDPRGMLRAAYANLRAGRVVEGGSTITQQLVKLSSGDQERTLDRKIREALTALRLTRSADKDEILSAYLNSAYFGEGAYGLEAASHEYFGHPAATLTLSEAAQLVAVLPSPPRYSPRNDPDAAERRRLEVLADIEAAGFATLDELTVARAERPVVVPAPPNEAVDPYLFDWVRQLLLDAGFTLEDLHEGGLRVELTVDPRLQDAAFAAAHGRLPTADLPEVALVSVEPQTGFVRAIVGGRDHQTSQVNLALGTAGGGSGRQPGSSFKPVVLAAALSEGWDLTDRVNAPETVQPPGFLKPVGNASGRGYGRIDLVEATRWSVNTAYVNLTSEVGVDKVVAAADALGMHSVADAAAAGPVSEAVSIGLVETSPLQLAATYATFASGGVAFEPTPILKVTDSDGHVLLDHTDRAGTRVLDKHVARDVTTALEAVVTDGTGTAAALGDRPAAGKTGTTNDYVDALFAGYVPQLSTAVWVGFPQGRIPMLNVAGVARVGGGTIPAEIWQHFMAAATGPLPVVSFDETLTAREVAEQLADAAAGPKPRRSRPLVPAPSWVPQGAPELRPVPPATPPTTTTTVPSTTTSTTSTTIPEPSTTTSTTVPTTSTSTSTTIPDDGSTTTSAPDAPSDP